MPRRGLPPAPLHLLVASGAGLYPTPHLTAVAGFGLHYHHTFPVVARLGVVSHRHNHTSWRSRASAPACTVTTPSWQSRASAWSATGTTIPPSSGRFRLALPPHHTTQRSRAAACTVTTPSRWSRASLWSPTGTTTPPGGGRPRLALRPHHNTRRSRASACAHHHLAVAGFGLRPTPHLLVVADFGLHCHHTSPVVTHFSVVCHRHHYTSQRRQAQACTPTTPYHPAVMGFGLRPTPHLPGGRAPRRALPPAPHLPAVVHFGLQCHTPFFFCFSF